MQKSHSQLSAGTHLNYRNSIALNTNYVPSTISMLRKRQSSTGLIPGGIKLPMLGRKATSTINV